MIRVLLFILLSMFGLSYLIQNTHQIITIQYFIDFFTFTLPAYHLVIGAFGMGMLLTGILIFPGWIRLHLELRRLRKSLEHFGKALSDVHPGFSERSPATSDKRKPSDRTPEGERENGI